VRPLPRSIRTCRSSLKWKFCGAAADLGRITGKPERTPAEGASLPCGEGGHGAMKKNSHSRKHRKHPKARLRLPDLEFSRTAVLNSLTSVDGQRGYGHAIDEFVDWYCSEPRLAFNRTVVLRYRGYLEAACSLPGRSTCAWALFGAWPMRQPIAVC
jgi:hypothetical protein